MNQMQIRGQKLESPQKLIPFVLKYRPPLDWDHQLAFLKSHQIRGVERIDDQCYERMIPGGFFRIEHKLEDAEIHLFVPPQNIDQISELQLRVRQMLDLDLDPAVVHRHLDLCGPLQASLQNNPGVRLPKAFDRFETLMTTVLGQLVSVAAAQNLVAELVRNLGEAVIHPVTGEERFLFPSALKIAASPLTFLKTTGVRRQTLLALARMELNGELPWDDVLSFKKTLLAVKGIGPWTAEYVSLRALGDTESFPGSDLILKRVLSAFPEIDIEKLKPWSAYAAIHLWRAYAKDFSGKNYAAGKSNPKKQREVGHGQKAKRKKTK